MGDAATALSWQAVAVSAAADRLGRLATETMAVQAGIDGGLRHYLLGHRWRGPGSAAALCAVERRAQVLRRVGSDLAAAARRLVEGATRLARVQAGLRSSVGLVRSDHRLTYDPSGAVSVDWRQAGLALVRDSAFGASELLPLLRLARDMGARICDAVVDSQRVDRDLTDSVEELAASARATMRADEPDLLRGDLCAQMGSTGFSRWLSALPDTTASPQDVADWWAAHTTEEQTSLTDDAGRAERLGALDGLPSAVRDRINRSGLVRRLAGYAGDLADLDRQLAAAGADAGARLLRRRSLLVRAHRVDVRVAEQLRAIDGWVDPVTRNPMGYELLIDEPERWNGQGRVSVSLGRVDDAEHVAYLVPGLGQRVDPGLDRFMESARHVYDAAGRLAPAAGVAVVAWLAYDAPGWAEVAFESRARAGAALLARDIDGLRASWGDRPPHLTVIGHSYGSTTASLAIQQADASVDDIAFVGSPGVLAGRAADLPVPEGHVWVGAASGDEISHLSRFGIDPAAADFGAHRFPAEAPPGTPAYGQHTRYFDVGSQSVLNLARIAVGDGSEVATAPGRRDSGILGAMEKAAFPLPLPLPLPLPIPLLSLSLPPPLLLPLPVALPLPVLRGLTIDPTFGDPAGS